MDDEDFPPRTAALGAWSGFKSETLWAKPVEREGICVITASNDQGNAPRQTLATLYDLDPPERIGCISNATTSLIATAPQTWMLFQTGAERTLANDLREKLGGLATVTDQSGAYARLRLGGLDAQRILQKGVFLDLDNFGAGSTATTHLAHLRAMLWRAGAEPVFDLALFRSTARDFLHWLAHAARLPSSQLDPAPPK